MRRILPLLALLMAAPLPAGAQALSGYAGLIEPDDREAVAAKPLQDRLATQPADRAAARELLQVYRRFGDYEAGEALGARLAAETPDDGEIFEARLALASRRIDDSSLFSKKSAAESLLALCNGERARNPHSIPALSCIAQYHLIAPSIAGGDKAKAEEAIGQMQALDEGQYLLLRANQALAADDEAKGKTLLTEALPKLNDADDLVGVGLQLGRMGEVPLALSALDRAVALDPADPFILYQSGRAAAVTGQRLEAGRDALLRFLSGSTWIAGVNYRAGAHWRLGQILEKLDDKVLAERAYRRALALEPKHKEAQAALKALKKVG